MPEPAPNTAFLRRRNALWQTLRQIDPGTPAFEANLLELSALTGWSRARVLAGLGLDDAAEPASDAPEARTQPE